MGERVKFPETIDASARRAFVACPKSYYYKYLLGLHRKTEISLPLLSGKAFARGLEVARWHYWAEEPSIEKAFGEGAKALIYEWGDYDVMEGQNRSLWNMLLALYHYCFYAWPFDEDPLRPWIRPTGLPAVEYSFDLEIPETRHPETGNPIRYQGRFDMLAEYGGKKIVVDEKTAGQLGATFHNGWDLRSQVTGYIWCARQYGHEIGMAAIRGISPQKREIKTAEVFTFREPWQVDQWLDQLRDDLEHMIWYWKREKWPLNLDDSCTAFGGCPYSVLCTAKNPQSWIDVEFEESHWDPLA